MKDCIKAAKNVLPGILQGIKIFIQKMAESAMEISHVYSREGNRWVEQTQVRYVDESEVPEDIRRRTEYKMSVSCIEEFQRHKLLYTTYVTP